MGLHTIRRNPSKRRTLDLTQSKRSCRCSQNKTNENKYHTRNGRKLPIRCNGNLSDCRSAGNVMEDFNVKITVRNNRLLQAILKKYKSVADLARKMNRSQSRVNALVTMKAKPITEKGWTQLAFDVAAMVGKEPKKLWPEHLQNIKLLTSTSEFTINIEGVKQIMSDNSVEKMIAQSQVLRQLDTRLNNTQKKVIDMRFYQEMTLEETGKVLGLSRERIRQIECKSLRMMRYDARTQGYLKPRSKNNKNLLAKLEKTNQGCELFE
jgi:DNA-binding XRE family transcriptional regulator